MASALIQIPTINTETQIRQTKIRGGFIWAIRFKLERPAAEDGHIVQHIIQIDRGTQKEDGVVVKSENRTIQYWEAWEVKKGETEPRQTQTIRSFAKTLGVNVPAADTTLQWDLPMHDIFFRKYPVGARGVYTINGLAGFYQQPLPPDFVVGHCETGAGALKSTVNKPAFWTIAGLNRQLRFDYTFETPEEFRDDSKQHLNGETTKTNMSFFDNWLVTEKHPFGGLKCGV